MQTLYKLLFVAIAIATATVSASAAMNYGTSAGQPYVGVKVGQANYNKAIVSGNTTYIANKPIAYGVFGGYQLDQNFGAEVEYVSGRNADITNNNVKNGNISVKTYGAYGTYKYGIDTVPVYAKAKLGIAKTDVKIQQTETKTVGNTGLAYGLGVGYQASPNLAIEAEYAKAKGDVSLWAVGATAKF